MNLKVIFTVFLSLFSFVACAENLELFDPIPGAVKYEITLQLEGAANVTKVKLDKPILDTNEIPAGDYVMRARYQNVRNKWSEWTDKASLKIVKKIKNSTKTVFEDQFPFGASIGYASLQTELKAGSYKFDSNESVIKTRGFIQRQAFKINVAYDKSPNFTRFDAAVLKQITPHASSGVNFWMVNFDGRSTNSSSKGLINYTQAFFEFDYMYPFLERWYAGAKLGLGWGISYFAKPEITYSIPFGKAFFVSTSVMYEMTHVEQSSFKFEATGFGGLVNLNYFLEI